MPSLEYFLVCRSASVDVHSDELTLSGVLDDVFLEDDEYTVLPKAVAVGAWNLTADDMATDFQALLRVTRPGETVGRDFPVNLSKGRHRLRALFAIEVVPLDTPGELTFELLLNSLHAAGHRVTVHPSADRPPADPAYPKREEQPPPSPAAA